MKKTAFILMILTILSKNLGFLRDITLSYFYGASNVSDAYLISLTIPTTIFAFIGSGIATSYIPIYSTVEKEEGINKAAQFSNNLINLLLIIATLVVIFGSVFTVPIVKLFASGFQGETLALTTRFTKITIFGVYFSGLVYIFSSYLQINSNFVVPALIGFPLNIIIIVSIILSYKINVIIIAIGSVVASCVQVVVLVLFAYRSGYRYKSFFDVKDKYITKMAYLSIPVSLGVSVNQINILVDRTISSQITVGGISALNYANRLNGFVQGIFVLSITTAIYPMISKMAAENNMNVFKKYVCESINSISLFVVPATVGAMIFAEPVVKLLFGRGAFDVQAIQMTSYALYFYSLGMITSGFNEVLSRTFYSLHDTKTPMVSGVIAVVTNIILNIILSRFLGIGGLSLATSISSMVCTILLLSSLQKKIGSFGMRNITISFLKIGIASITMGILTRFIYSELITNIDLNMALALAIVLGVIIYFTIIRFMRIKEVDEIIFLLKKNLRDVIKNIKS